MDPSCFGCGLVFRWWRVLAFYAIRIAFVVAALLSVPGFRHVGAQGFSYDYGDMI